MTKLYLIDGNAYIHRAYHAMPPLTTSRGEAVNAVYGFLRLLMKIIRSERPEYLAVCFDHPSPTFRHREYPAYKAQRKAMDDELRVQIPLAHEAVTALGIALLEKPGYEADDIIATMARSAERDGAEVVVITTDKDILQLVNARISVWNEFSDVRYDRERVREKFGVFPEQLGDMLSLMGDASDNIPGAPGVGEKTAARLIAQYGSLDGVFRHADDLKGKLRENLLGARAEVEKSRFLVTLCDTVPLDIAWSATRAQPPEEQRATEFIRRMEFTSMLDEVLALHRPAAEAETPAPLPPVCADFSVTTVLTREDLGSLADRLAGAPMFALDLETTGTDPLEASIVGISLALDTEGAWYIPVGHAYLGAPEQLTAEAALDAFRPALENASIRTYGQNIKFDMLVLRRYGVRLAGISFDTMVASYCLNPSRFTHNLKDITLDYLGQRMTPIEELIGKGKGQITMDRVEIERTAPYACADAVMVLRLAEKLEPQLREKKLEPLFRDVEMPLIEVLADMEEAGLGVNVDYLGDLAKRFAVHLGNLEAEIYRIAGQEFNPNSPKQLGTILFEKLKLPVVRKTKTGYSTDEEVLRTLAPHHDLPGKLIEFRELQKLKSTYIEALLERADRTHRVHTSFNQTVTATGRLSSSDPNLQNIPVRTEYGREIRRAFVPERGCVFVSADYSQIDLRVLAHVSGDEALVNAFRNGEDIHRATAAEVFKVKLREVSPEMRRIAKTINFGIVYGMSAFGLSQQLGVPQKDSREYIESYFARYEGVRRWSEAIIAQAREQGYVSTILGRIRYIPEIGVKDNQARKFAERTAMNTPIQGSSADIIKVAMIRLARELVSAGRRCRMLVQVHDEILFEMPEDELSAVVPLVKREMEGAVALSVPLTVDVKAGGNWSDMLPVEVQA